MSTQLLEQGKNSPEVMEARNSFFFPPFTAKTNSAAPALVFEWQTGEDDSDSLTWRGDIDAVLGWPQGAFPRTFSAWIEAIHPDDRDAVLNAIEAHLLSDEPYCIDCRALRADGSIVCWTHCGQATRDANGDPIALVGTLRDIAPQNEGADDTQNGANGFHLDIPANEPTDQSEAASIEGEDSPETPTSQAEPAIPILPVLAVTDTDDAPDMGTANLVEPDAAPLDSEVSPAPLPSLSPTPTLTGGVSLQNLADDDPTISAEQRALDQQARAQALLRAAAHLNAQLDLQEVCDAICQEAARTIGAPSAVMLFNKVRDAFVPTSVRGMPVDYEKRYIPTPRTVYDGHVAAMGTLFLFTDAQATPDLPNHKLYGEVNMRTIGIASLIREGEVLGLLKVYSFGESRTFTANELAFIQGLADIAAQAIANARLLADSQRRMANIGALREIDKAILGSNDVNLALGVVLDQVVSRLGADSSSALLLDPHTRALRYAVGRGFRTNTPRRTDWQLGEGLAGRAALERRIIHVPDLSRPELIAADFTAPDLKLPGLNPTLDAARANTNGAGANGVHSDHYRESASLRRTGIPNNEGFVSYHGVPLVANGQVKGVLEVWHRSPLQLDEEDLEFLETLAGQAAIAVDNATLFRDLQRSNDELILAYDSTLAGWSGALDLRDKETEGHSERVTRETLRLAREMGIRDADLVHVRRGALLHDIGKMGIPDGILLKPGPLSDEEWLVMKKHPTYALELLSPIEYLRPALDIPYAHHEKWDGSGYPRGLSGEQIPLTARLFAVVDVWDALCSDRPYRQGWPIKRVLEHIREGSGTHFDPAVVEAFLRLHEHELEAKLEFVTASVPVLQPTAAPEPLPPAPEPEPTPRASWSKRLFQFILGVKTA